MDEVERPVQDTVLVKEDFPFISGLEKTAVLVRENADYPTGAW